MIKCNLCNNDIIVILVIFIFFCIFMYINVNNTYEKFQSNDNWRKKEYSDLLDHFVGYYDEVVNLNKGYHDLLINIKQGKIGKIEEQNSDIISVINKLHTNGSKIKHTTTELSYNLNKIVTINKKYYDLLEEKIVIVDCELPATTQTNALDDPININLYKKKKGNETKKYDIATLEKTIIKITSLINKIDFDPYYKTTLIELFNSYLSITKNLYKIDIIDTLSKPCDVTQIDIIIDLLNKNIDNVSSSYDVLENLKTLPEIDKLKKKFVIYGDEKNYFERTKDRMNLESRLCEKLKKLDKPNKNNLILKRFTDDLIDKKNKYVSQLENKITDIQSLMTDKELADYETYMYRTNDQAKKQFKAIKQGISNIKNNNKVKINLT